MKEIWCYEIGAIVKGAFYEDNELIINELDSFQVIKREKDEEGNQYYKLKCLRNNEIFENVPASLIE